MPFSKLLFFLLPKWSLFLMILLIMHTFYIKMLRIMFPSYSNLFMSPEFTFHLIQPKCIFQIHLHIPESPQSPNNSHFNVNAAVCHWQKQAICCSPAATCNNDFVCAHFFCSRVCNRFFFPLSIIIIFYSTAEQQNYYHKLTSCRKCKRKTASIYDPNVTFNHRMSSGGRM